MSENGNPLSERELEILNLVATGASNQEIARELVISPNTVKVHLRNIFEKLQVQSRTEASMVAIQHGWVRVRPGAVEGEVTSTPTTEARPPRPQPTPQPLPRWKRGYLAFVLVLTLAAFLIVQVRATPLAARRSTPFSDAGAGSSLPPQALSAPSWTARAFMPTARSRLAVAEVGGKVYAIAGETDNGPTGQMDVYDPQSNGWLPGPTKPLAVANVAAAVLDGRLVVPGGTLADGTLTNTVEAFDPSAGLWEAGPPLPKPLCCYALAAYNDRLYLFGGWDGTEYVAEVWSLGEGEVVWRAEPPMPTARGFHGAATIGGRIYVVGGYDGRRELAVNEAFVPTAEGGRWETHAPLQRPRGGLAVAATDSVLVAIGGGWTAPLLMNERYDPKKDVWTEIQSPFLGQWRHLAAVATENRILALGGFSGAPLANMQEYRATFKMIVPILGGGGGQR